ncbi:hypothetical protein [Bacillus mycoides]|uniref:hypothetical protein n=1 Tax=Bacillus mycoides TaxID=1405 RepID=UPI0002E36AE8|nr:hypothetical protein [Bacillus mycoides]
MIKCVYIRKWGIRKTWILLLSKYVEFIQKQERSLWGDLSSELKQVLPQKQMSQVTEGIF